MASPNPSITATASGLMVAAFMWPLLVAINVTQMVSLVLLPVSRPAFRAYNRWCANLWWGLCVRSIQTLYGTTAELVGDDVPERENVILVCNHQSMADIVVLFFLARPKHRLGDLKWFVKDPIKYVPGVGWGMLFLACLFVKRNWSADRAGIERTFATVIGEDLPVWVISFSEGTRRTPEKLASSREYAEKASLTPTDHVMVPRTKGFVATVTGLREHCDAVYDVTIGYPGDNPPSLWDLACGVGRRFSIHVHRHGMADLPEDPDGLSNWLIDRFVDKNDRMAAFARDGRFPSEAVDAPTP